MNKRQSEFFPKHNVLFGEDGKKPYISIGCPFSPACFLFGEDEKAAYSPHKFVEKIKQTMFAKLARMEEANNIKVLPHARQIKTCA